MNYFLLLMVSLLTCGGQLCQKQAVECWRIRPASRRLPSALRWLFAACCALGIAILLWLAVLQRMPLGVAYPMLSINFVLVTLSAHFWFGERASVRHWCGVALIMVGIYLMSRGL
ncbi:undecaprenyl phosphate-alpha-L-ara4N flippase subunit ArnE [Enterobacillus tribolii]|uniref:Probable 4-amino-4-deoxy-L-arabinose-phosphoundecaprenol flippase subunit ArnE n=2 Tax=Enterobacillus tribolii TaxID=1487935 RepID=A0A370R3M9_9GAMM|nr:4-amino-4-deoxy-L-arabinose-phosphoundecaprenol flippase subunit ArnE [Enterobacillus tribolii]RDK97032.1 undecaprenyl phosphate-alpha-L-ara4N flippase subunit ArnE [Enterobacillus tribolii]